jgi:hypothetical protein
VFKTHQEQLQAVREACALFPETFCLAGFPGETFRVSERNSYWNGNEVQVYTDVLRLGPDGQERWSPFAKGSVAELKAQVFEVRIK